MRLKTKFYGYRAAKATEDKRILRLKRAVGCRSTTRLLQLGLENLEEKFLPSISATVNENIKMMIDSEGQGADK